MSNQSSKVTEHTGMLFCCYGMVPRFLGVFKREVPPQMSSHYGWWREGSGPAVTALRDPGRLAPGPSLGVVSTRDRP